MKWSTYYTGSCKKIVLLFEFPALAAPRQTDQPMHSKSVKTEHLQAYCFQLTEVFFLDPVIRFPLLSCLGKSISWLSSPLVFANKPRDQISSGSVLDLNARYKSSFESQSSPVHEPFNLEGWIQNKLHEYIYQG